MLLTIKTYQLSSRSLLHLCNLLSVAIHEKIFLVIVNNSANALFEPLGLWEAHLKNLGFLTEKNVHRFFARNQLYNISIDEKYCF